MVLVYQKFSGLRVESFVPGHPGYSDLFILNRGGSRTLTTRLRRGTPTRVTCELFHALNLYNLLNLLNLLNLPDHSTPSTIGEIYCNYTQK